ncbi:M23 family metallopeptidase [Alicyclobacillus dauci]|uniref:M23 family metallopeptidase n=1 Tax=Alicyclobacillus dauci TaxID=1475485 RepID=A0ABY6Z277_9BACL|nr:M23 family metallopeptidase [Alicyclobacillus dauci]WAH36850.1 M23 family metallopeptidase [Alicyclobacillus dauci]
MDEKQHPNENKNADPQNKSTGRPVNAKRVLSKRWLYPAIYLGAAAVIIGLMYARSQLSTSPTSSTGVDTNTAATGQTVTQPKEPFVWPVADGTDTSVAMGFFPQKGSLKAQEAALVNYDNTYYAHKGVDIKTKDGSSFQVTAALSGKIVTVDNQPLYGQEVIVQSADGYTEKYQSLGSVDVKKGDTIHQGQTIGTTTSNEFEKSQGNHLYFEVDYNGTPIDPESVLPKQ